MTDSLFISTIIPTGPEVVYRVWLDSHSHSLFIGSPAEINPAEGGSYSAWDGYIGRTTLLELTPGVKIVQSWRTAEFPASSPDSLIIIALETAKGSTRVPIDHKNIPKGQRDNYIKGWEEYYFFPMKAYNSTGVTAGE